MKYTWILCLLAMLPKIALAQEGETSNLIFYVDSVYIPSSRLTDTDPDEVTFLQIYKNTILDTIDNKVKDGKIYAFTKSYAAKHYWHFFSSNSEAYKKLVPTPRADADIQYILNGELVKEDIEAALFRTTIEHKFQSLNIIDHKQLLKQYHLSSKRAGVVIKTKK